jgi:hypothetical protein
MDKCDDKNLMFSRLFAKTLSPRFPGVGARSFLFEQCPFSAKKTREMKSDLRRCGKDREGNARIPEDFASSGASIFPSPQRRTGGWFAGARRLDYCALYAVCRRRVHNHAAVNSWLAKGSLPCALKLPMRARSSLGFSKFDGHKGHTEIRNRAVSGASGQ